MSADFDKAIELCYELEGLVMLAKERNDISSRLTTLIQGKTDEIMALLSEDKSVEAETFEVPLSDDACEAPLVEDSSVEIVSTDNDFDNIDDSEYIGELDDCIKSDENCVNNSKTLRQLFTINDKFLYRRELFGNSDTEFTDTINLVSAMSNFAEAQDYFFGDLEWDTENEEVVDFMSVIEKYFKTINRE